MESLINQALCFRNTWREPSERDFPEQSISVVIPVFHPTYLPEVIRHLREIGGFQEIILIDDSGEFCSREYDFLEEYDSVRVVFHEKNLGRPAARNTGAAYAGGDILVFMDQDMFLDPDFFSSLNRYYAVNESMIFLGCRETKTFDEIPSKNAWVSPDLHNDWRIQTEVMPDFVDLTVLGVGSVRNNCKPHEILSLYASTDRLRKLGISADSTLGFWDLPSMVVSHSMAMTRKDFYRLGGFPEWIQGWGGEDIVLGFLACAAHIPICLSACASYQAYHLPYSGSDEAKIAELKRNISNYRKWVHEIDAFPDFRQEDKLVRGHIRTVVK